jgi:predicted RNase H-like HicB family nuclease
VAIMPPETVEGFGTVSAVSGPLRLTIVYEDAGDGWVLARIPQVRGAISQGQTREEARDNVLDALREVLAVRSADRQASRTRGTATWSSSRSPREAGSIWCASTP